MNSNQMSKKPSHHHIFPHQETEHRHSRSKIELTHIQNPQYAPERSNYSSVNGPKPPEASTNHDPSLYQSKTYQYQFPQGNPQFNNRLYGLMKQQIDIAAFNYRQKINQTIKIQAKEIQKLTALLGYNHKMLQKQQQIIDKMGANEDFMTSTVRSQFPGRDELRNTSKSPRKISLTQNKSAKKLNTKRSVSPLRSEECQNETLNLNMRALQRSLDELDEKIWSVANKNREMMSRLGALQKMFEGQTWRRIQKSQQTLRKYITNNESKLSTLESNTINRSNEIREVNKKLSNLAEEMKEMKELMFNLLHRQFNYDSYQVNILRDNLKKIQNKVNSLSNRPTLAKKSIGMDSPQRIQKVKHKKLHHNSLLNHSYSIGHQGQYDADPLLENRLSSQEQFSPNFNNGRDSEEFLDEDGSEGSEDEFYFEEAKPQISGREHRLGQLQAIMVRNGSKFPVRVEIDGTGYLKEQATGMYILDEYDNGFELTPQQLQTLKLKNIITM